MIKNMFFSSLSQKKVIDIWGVIFRNQYLSNLGIVFDFKLALFLINEPE